MPAPYHKITPEDLENLKKICPDRVLSANEIREDDCHDELSGTRGTPDALVKVLNAGEVSAVLRYAGSNNIAVTPRGAGTGLVGGSVAMQGGILLDMRAMNHILELDEKNMTLTVEPGVLLMDVAKFATEHDFLYPPDPGEKTATIGGNISTNAGGMRAVKYGVTRDYVLGLQVVLPDGAIVELGGKVRKNSSGYSLKDLIIGSEGTLGVVTRATLRLLHTPKCKTSLLVPFPDLPSAIRTVPAVAQARSVPTAIEFMEKEVILASEKFLARNFPDHSSDAYLLLTFDGGSKEEVELACTDAAEICLQNGAIDVFISDTPEREESIWKSRGSFLEAIKASTSEMDECDVVVPRDRVADFVLFSCSLQDKYGVRIRSFGHAGDGNLHIYILRDELTDEQWQDILPKTFGELYDKAHEMGGKVSGEHGIGFAKKPFLARSLSQDEIRMMQGIKRVFDPLEILNPGKIFALN